MSCVKCNFFIFYFFVLTKWLGLLVEGLLTTGRTPSSLIDWEILANLKFGKKQIKFYEEVNQQEVKKEKGAGVG